MAQDIVIKITVDDKDVKSTLTELQKLGKVDDENAKKFNDNSKKFQDSQKKNKESVGGLATSIKGIGATIVTAFGVQQLISFGQQILKVTSDFQRLEAVLTNTLGSNSEAQKSLAMIQQFASATPFSVLELTDSFVKLTNQGFKPTQQELTKLGDLASSTGKNFDMLAEAIIDAQVGEFERLKEFGIRARKEGDNVAFTFKGVKTEVDNTEASIRAYITGLGELNGVSGAMASISKTAGGQVSNLGDSWDRLLNNIGQSNSGFITDALTGINNLVSSYGDLFDTQEKEQDVLEGIRIRLNEELDVITKGNLSKEAMEIQIKNINEQYGEYLPNLIDEKASLGDIITLQDQVNKQLQSKILYLAYEEEFVKIMKEQITVQKGIVEGEVAIEKAKQKRAKETDNLLAQQQDLEAKILEGGVGIAKSIEAGIKPRLESLETNYTDVATRMGLVWEDVVGKFGVVAETTANKQKELTDKEKSELDKRAKQQEDFYAKARALAEKSIDEDAKVTEDFWKRRNDIETQLRESQVQTIADDTQREIEEVKLKYALRIEQLDSSIYDENELIQSLQAERDLILEEKAKEHNDKIVKINQDSADKQKAIDQATFQSKMEILGSIGDLFNTFGQLAFQTKEEQRAFALAQIAFNTAQAIASLVAISEANPLNSVTFGASGIAQYIAGIARIFSAMASAKQQLAGFKDGVIMLQGDGTETSDSIPVRLSKNESVIKARQSKKYPDLLRAINDDELDKYLQYNWHKLPIPKSQISNKDTEFIGALTNTLGRNNFNADEIVDTLKRIDRNDNKRTSMLVTVLRNNSQQNLRKR